MEFAPATPEQIDVFVKAAMDRYEELGVPEDVASVLLQNQLAKYAAAMGIVEPDETEKQAALDAVDEAVSCIAKQANISEADALTVLEEHIKRSAHSNRRIATFKDQVKQALAANN